jgi:hypothetical protein
MTFMKGKDNNHAFAPRLSVVATTRNDDHGGNQIARTQLFIRGLAEQCDQFKLPVELLLVEWNPPPDRPPLAQALNWSRSDWFEPRVLVVPGAVHNRLEHSEKLPLFQMLAKNVGIRRASAPFILATNIDILLSDELFTFLRDGLKPNAMYRADRLDVVANLNANPLPSPAECRALPWVRANRLDGPHNADGGRPPWYSSARTWLNRTAWNTLHGGALPNLHTWASGDFTLTSREIWSSLRGYPEWPMFSMFLDSVLLVQAFRAGVEMIRLPPPMVLYHLEHGAGSGWTPEGARVLSRRLDGAGIPYLTGSRYDRIAREILRKGPGFHPFNGEDWGLASADLQVVEPVAA